METIALFGGSFDPPHIGHKAVVDGVLKIKDVKKVIIMPTFLNPFKTKSHAPAQLRLKWLRDIFSGYKNVEVSSWEVEQNKKVPTIQTVLHLLESYKKIYLVIGADNLSSLKQWDRFEELEKLVSIVVASRDGIVIEENFITLDINHNISSTSLREDIQKAKLPKTCAKEIEKFYKENNAKQN